MQNGSYLQCNTATRRGSTAAESTAIRGRIIGLALEMHEDHLMTRGG